MGVRLDGQGVAGALVRRVLYVPYHQKYPEAVPRPVIKRVSSSALLHQQSYNPRRIWQQSRRTESDGEIEDQAPTEHLNALVSAMRSVTDVKFVVHIHQ